MKNQVTTILMAIAVMATGCVPAATPGANDADSTFKLLTPYIHTAETHVETMPLEGEPLLIENGHAALTITDQAAMMQLATAELEPGHVYTAWWVIMNNPKRCETSPCGPEDILGNTDSVGAEITWADGIVADALGHGKFAATLPVGEVPNPWFGNGFSNPQQAEIHIVLNHHGPLIPEMAANMMSSYRGGCTDDSLPPPFPDTAKSDGQPGPNDCLLIQDAIFQQ